MHYGIIAAGEGSRLVQEGVSLPKPLVEINGEPMIGRLIRIFTECGAESVAVIVNSQMKEVEAYLRALAQDWPVPIRIVVKSTPSSMHSFYEMSSLMKGLGRFVLTTVDTIFRIDDFKRYCDAFAEAPAEIDGMMAVTQYVDDEKPLYVATDNAMDITAFLDSPEPDTRFVSGGIYGLSEPAIAVLEDCLEKGVSRMRNYQRALVGNGLRLKAFDMGKILDVDHASDIAKANELLS